MPDIIRITDLRGGLVTDPPSYLLQPNEFRDLKNLFIRGINRQASLRLRQGQRDLVSTAPLSVLGFVRYRNRTINRLVYGVSSTVVQYTEPTGPAATIWSGGSGPTSSSYEFAQMLGYLFWVDEQSQLMMWDGTTAGVAGITPPNVAVVKTVADYALVPGGNLDSYGLPNYRYVMTYVSADGIESNPSPEGLSIAADHKEISLSALPVSSDPRVTTKNLYRIGGLLTRYTKVEGGGQPPIANSDTSAIDNIADVDMGTTQLSYARSQAPARGEDIIVWKNRLVVSQGYTLAVSNLGEPWYFPTTISNPDTDGAIFEVDPSYENPIVGMCLSGSALLIACMKSFFLLMGDTTDTFSLIQIASIGCVARRSLVQCGNIAMWLAPDKMVYGMSDSGPVAMARDIERTLKNLPAGGVVLEDACACYFREQYHLCIPAVVGFPTTNPGARYVYYFVYDFRYGKWVDLSERYMAATMLYSDTGRGDTDEVLFATQATNYAEPDDSAFTGIVAAFGSPVIPLGFDARTGDLLPELPEESKRASSIRIRGKFSGESGSAIIYAESTRRGQLLVDSEVSYALPLTSGEGVLLDRDLPSNIKGQRINVRVRGVARVFELDDIAIGLTDTGKEGR